MAIRTRLGQSEHDMVLQVSADTYPATDTVYTNPNGERNCPVGGLYPDIVALRGTGDLERITIEEIETEDSVNAAERDHQWTQYASLGCTFHLVVPRTMLCVARDLIRGLDVDFLQWYEIENGRVRFGNDA